MGDVWIGANGIVQKEPGGANQNPNKWISREKDIPRNHNKKLGKDRAHKAVIKTKQGARDWLEEGKKSGADSSGTNAVNKSDEPWGHGVHDDKVKTFNDDFVISVEIEKVQSGRNKSKKGKRN